VPHSEFGRTLADYLHAAELRAPALADAIGVTDDTVRKWINGAHAPDPATVFAVEETLGLPPGELSRHLGYVPVDAPAVTAAIEADPGLSPNQRAMLTAAYRAARRRSTTDPT
jgi:transcriptional regulator with XRE-family HTH domain